MRTFTTMKIKDLDGLVTLEVIVLLLGGPGFSMSKINGNLF